jgi:hypothetical protein
MATTASAELIKRTIPPLTVWAVGRLVELPRVKKTLRRVDASVLGVAVKHRRSIPRQLLRVAAGLAFVAFGAALILRTRQAHV